MVRVAGSGPARPTVCHGVPQEVLTDNGKVFTGRFRLKDTEVLFDRRC